MPEVEVTAGPIGYGDSGEGKPIVFIGGLPHDWGGAQALISHGAPIPLDQPQALAREIGQFADP